MERMELTHSLRFLALAALAIVALAACGLSDFEGRDGVPANGLKVTQEEYGDIWVLVPKLGTLECAGSSAAVFHHGGSSYALNAQALEQGYSPVSPIRKVGDKLTRAHYDIAVASGDMSPNIRTFEQFRISFINTKVYDEEFPHLVDQLMGDLGAITDLALTLC